MNLFELLVAAADDAPSSPAVTDLRDGGRLDYAGLRDEAERMAELLRRAGVQAGDRVGLLAGNALAYLPAAWAILARGACLTPIAPGQSPAEVEALLREIGVNACLAWAQPDPARGLLGEAAATAEEGVCAGFTLHTLDRDREPPEGFSATDPAFIRFTSGTTSVRKGVILSHDATRARAEAAAGVLALSAADRVLWVLPLAYHFAVTITSYVAAGAHLLLCPDALPHAVAKAIHGHRTSLMYASPVHFDRLASVGPADEAEGTTLRLAISTTAPLAEETAVKFERSFGLPLGQAYGIIEAGLPCINTRQAGLPATSVGPAVPGYGVAILGEGGESLARGEVGEVGVRGPGLFAGYYSPWRPRAEVLRDGWFLTGDMGRLDATGALTLVGRKKSVLVVAGLKVFPEEVEDVLLRHEAVREARIFGRPHAHLGEVPVADVVPRDPEHPPEVASLRRHCASSLSSLKVPVEFRMVESLPRTSGGKLLRRDLRSG